MLNAMGKKAMAFTKGVRVGLREKVTIKRRLGARFPGESISGRGKS